MICNGLLSIDHMKEYRGPVSLVCNRIPRPVLERAYGVVLPPPTEYEDPNRPPTSEELLQACATVGGYFSSHGVPNESIVARHILKDYVNVC
jgi:large subunit GTPase 1